MANDLENIGHKYPALKSSPVRWESVKAMLKSDGVMAADDMAREMINSVTRLRVRNKIAVRHRIERREYLKSQKNFEAEVLTIFDRLADAIMRLLVNVAGDDGKIPYHKSKAVNLRIRALNLDAWADYRRILSHSVIDSIKFGLDVTMKSAQAGIEFAKELGEADKTAIIFKNSQIYQTIFDRVKKERLQTGLFKRRVVGGYQRGQSLSRSVWDLRDENLRKLRRMVSTGIAQGEASTSIARKAREYTVDNSYKNALRMARSETNQAYHDAEIEYAAAKGYQKMWNTSTDPCEICQGLDGEVYDAEDVPALPHPHCACWLSTVIEGLA